VITGRTGGNAAKLQSDLQHLADTCLNDLGIERPVLMADSTISLVTGEELAVEDQAHREMRPA